MCKFWCSRRLLLESEVDKSAVSPASLSISSSIDEDGKDVEELSTVNSFAVVEAGLSSTREASSVASAGVGNSSASVDSAKALDAEASSLADIVSVVLSVISVDVTVEVSRKAKNS